MSTWLGVQVELLWTLEPATEAKHRLYKRYLDAWWPIMLQPTPSGYIRPRVTYLDAFAGPGEYKGGDDGSPIFAVDRLLNHQAATRMGLSRDRVTAIFLEKSRPRYRHLVARMTDRFGPLDQLPIRVVVRHADASTDVPLILDETDAWGHPILAVFDSWGNVNVPLSTVRRIAQNRSSEVVTTFGPNWFSRRANRDPGQLDLVFGGSEYWQPADREVRPDERWRTWLHTYRDALARSGFDFSLNFKVVPKTGAPLYLIFGTGSNRGVAVMKDAMWKVDDEDGMSFEDPRVRGAKPDGQLDLFGEVTGPDPELLELATQRLRGSGAVEVKDLGHWLLCETARWRESDARIAIKALVENGAASVEPSTGRITRNSIVRLN